MKKKPTASPVEVDRDDERRHDDGGNDAWIADAWLAWITEDTGPVKRLAASARKGRNLARKGVRNFRLQPGVFFAQVLADGSSGEHLHEVTVRMDMIENPTWVRFIDAVAEDPMLIAQLAQGKLSETMAEAFDDEGESLFPFDLHELKNFCTCQGDGLICHATFAAHYHFAAMIQVDPMKLLQFRGRDIDWIRREIRERGHGDALEVEPGERDLAEDPLFEKVRGLEANFWGSESLPEMRFGIEGAASRPMGESFPVLRALGDLQPLNPAGDIAAILEPIIKAARFRIEQALDQGDADQAASDEELASEVASDGEEDLDAMVVAAARKHGALTTQFVAKALGVSPKEARDYLQRLVEEGRLATRGRGRGTRYVVV